MRIRLFDHPAHRFCFFANATAAPQHPTNTLPTALPDCTGSATAYSLDRLLSSTRWLLSPQLSSCEPLTDSTSLHANIVTTLGSA